MKTCLLILAVVLLTACTKEPASHLEGVVVQPPAVIVDPYIKYSISKGAHYCDKTAIKTFAGKSISLNVKFDSSAIYSNQDPANQADINKLVGFTEGSNNHVNSARFGWGWSNGALRIYAYSYAAGLRSSKEISVLRIGEPAALHLSINGNEYVFKVNNKVVTLPRSGTADTVSGYWQYPYFGGDETAPHDIYIYLQYL